MGYLTGTIDVHTTFDPKTDFRSGFDRFSPANLAANKPVVVPISGTRRVDHLHENLGAIRVELTHDDLREMDVGLSNIEVHGGRMSPKYMAEVEG